MKQRHKNTYKKKKKERPIDGSGTALGQAGRVYKAALMGTLGQKDKADAIWAEWKRLSPQVTKSRRIVDNALGRKQTRPR
jgi:hypothetical protein